MRCADFNNCYCADPSSAERFFEGDVKFLTDAGLDGVKIDGCGGERDISLYQQLLNQTGTNFLISDCHDSRAAADPSIPRAPPNATWCPFNTWRNSYDEAYTLYDTALFLLNMNARNTENVSRPGCWAMAGMLMVGVDSTHARWLATNSAPMNESEARVQFGGECILSSPLWLSFDPTNATAIDGVWDIITNTEAIAVNKLWAGKPGSLLDEAKTTVPMWCFQADRTTTNSTCAYASWQVSPLHKTVQMR
jgi:hypothetical protein